MTRAAAASQDFAILAEVARLATEDIELRPMLQRITDALAARLGWDLVALVRVDTNAGRFVCEALSSRLPTTLHVDYGREIGSGVVGEVAATARAVLIDDARGHANFVETQTNTLSELCVPLLVDIDPRPGEVVTASVGVGTVIPRSEPDRSALLHRTDRALYRAKAAGRNRVEVAKEA